MGEKMTLGEELVMLTEKVAKLEAKISNVELVLAKCREEIHGVSYFCEGYGLAMFQIERQLQEALS